MYSKYADLVIEKLDDALNNLGISIEVGCNGRLIIEFTKSNTAYGLIDLDNNDIVNRLPRTIDSISAIRLIDKM